MNPFAQHGDSPACGSRSHFNRRTILKAAGLSGLSWLTPVAQRLALASEANPARRAKSIILLWMEGGPSQLETFDPHPGKSIAAGTKAIKTAASGIQLATGLEQLAAQMEHISLVRNVVSKEGDHERAVYNVKTGFRPDPSLVHPAIGAALCHQFPNETDLPRHISILPGQWPGRGGYLGNQLDAFLVNDPQQPVPDVTSRVSAERFQRRLDSLDFVEKQFARERLADLEKRRTLHQTMTGQALRLMESDQLKAFDVSLEDRATVDSFGDTPFGRGCLAAARLVQAGVNCVEVTLSGWDTHVNNHQLQANNKKSLDAAFAGLIDYLRKRDLLDDTIVVCGGEFGRTPTINPTAGRDHWPHGFSIALAGGGIRAGHVVGGTDPEGNPLTAEQGTPIENIHATILRATGVEFERELDTPVGRPIKISEGTAIRELI